jgi:hypothetical protein
VVSKHKPLDENASTKDIVRAFNGLQGDFLNRCLRDNIDYANQADINDGEFNKSNASRVPYLFCRLQLVLAFTLYYFPQVTVSGFLGSTYPDDLPSQRALFVPLIEPLITQLVGPGTPYELFPRRGGLKNGTLPPVEVDLKTQVNALKFKTEGSRLSRAKQPGFATLYFNPSISLATR